MTTMTRVRFDVRGRTEGGGGWAGVMMVRGRVVEQELYPRRVAVVVDTEASPPFPGKRLEANKKQIGQKKKEFGGNAEGR